jgi:serine protease Do
MLDPVRTKAKLIALTGGAFLGGVLLASGLELTAGTQAASLLQSAPPSADVAPVAEMSRAFISISEAVTPAVVNITAERTVQMRGGGTHPAIPEEFRRFFGIPEGRGGEPRSMPQPSQGTGFIITQDGYIMTNNHVVENAERIRVVTADRRRFDATVVGRDPTTDIAVIKIEGTGLPVARLGSSDRTQVGEWVLAIGNPLGLENTVTAGIVSAKGRPLPILRQSLAGTESEGYSIEDFIQTDAAINPGNSGGPLVNLRGEVVGVNSAIASGTGYFTGYGFAVPIDLARRVGDDLIRYGRSRRPIMGVRIEDVDPEDAEVFQLPSVAGVKIQDFTPGGAAERSGLEPGDVVVRVDGEPVARVNELQRRIRQRNPGEAVTLDIIRYGRPMQFRLQLGEAPPTRRTEERTEVERPTEGRLGVRVAPVDPAQVRQHGFETPGGVLIVQVEPHGPLGRRGVQSGLRIRQIDRQAINSVEEFQRALQRKRGGEVVSLLLESPSGDTRIVNARIPE